MSTAPYGYCQCGCGEQTLPAKKNTRHGRKRGEPNLFLQGHQQRRAVGKRGQLFHRNGECVEWGLSVTTAGYGQVTVDGEKLYAHRFFYELAKGPIPDGLQIDHLCRNRACINPAHLEAVEQAVNLQRGSHTLLTPAAVRSIREAEESASELALRFGVSKETIWGVRSRKSWKNVA